MELRRVLIAMALVMAGYVVAIGAAPYWISPDPNLPNVAAKLGYNIDVAFLALLAWTAIAIIGLMFWDVITITPAASGKVSAKSDSRAYLRLETILVFVFFFLAYCPFFLARRGDFIEDKYFLTALWRMQCGDIPYKDFEFLYGPLMIYPAHYWKEMFGFSLTSYYFLYALLAAGFFATIAAVLQRYLPERRMRYLAFLILLPGFFDVLLGLNYIGWRRMLPVFAILLVAAQPKSARTVAAAAGLLGLELAYSLEYGLAGLAACGAVYAALWLRPGRGEVIAYGGALAAGSLIIGSAIIAILTGPALGDYISATYHVLVEAGAKGLGAFRFYWTVHSLAVFALLSVSVVVVAAGARRLTSISPSEGDRLMIAAVAYALISMKIAFQRIDIWHMVSPFIPLMLVFLLARPQSLFVLSHDVRRIGLGLCAAAAVATAIGFMPLGLWKVSGVVGGGMDILTSRPNGVEIASRHPSVKGELTFPNKDMIALAEYLGAEEQKHRPVMFYQNKWWASYHLGVCPIGYTFYDLMYSDELAPLAQTLAENPDTLIVMEKSSYDHLFGGVKETVPKDRKLRFREKLAAVVASVHYSQSPIENVIETKMWEENLGYALVRDFELDARFGKDVVLAKRESAEEEKAAH